MARRLTLVAGGGELVPHILAAIRRTGEPVQVLDLVGRADVADSAVVRSSLSDAPAMIAAINDYRTTHLLLAGGVHISDADREGLAAAFGLAGRLAGGLGDVGLAGMILLYCKMQRIKLVGAHDVAPELLAPDGQIAGPTAGAEILGLAQRALKAARAVGAIDLGQSVVLSSNRPIAAEDAAGTDALLARVAALRQAGLAGNGGRPLIFAKARKPRQPSFVDLPAIGPQTIVNAAAAGVFVVAVEAGATLLLDRPGIAAAATAHSVTVIGLRHV